ncbi:MAG: ATP-binding protein, partial [Verrucomicrobiota bacterium]
MQLHSFDRGISISASVKNYRYPHSHLLSFRINGGEWTIPEKKQSIDFAQLDPGSHRIEVRGYAVAEAKPTPVERLTVHIHAPFFAKKGVWVVAVSALSLMVCLILWGRYRLLAKHSKEISRSEENFRRLIDSSSDGIIQVGMEGRVILANEAAFGLFDNTELVGITLGKLLKNTDDLSEDEVLSLECGDSIDQRYLSIKSQAGEGRRAICTARPIIETGGYRLQFQDITEKVELEEQIQQSDKMQAIGTLAGGIAHDFNNLLSPIILNTQMALEDLEKPLNEKTSASTKEGLELSMEAARKAADLVDQILTFSRSSEKDEAEHILMHTTVHQAVKLLRGTIPSNVQVQFESSLTDESVLISGSRMHRILMNLGVNAYHAIGHECGVIKVSAKQTRDGVEVRVSDNGCGMPPEIQARIFEPFFTTRDTGKGTGLGLSTVHGIITDLGGRIDVESELGEGTTFTLWLPLSK